MRKSKMHIKTRRWKPNYYKTSDSFCKDSAMTENLVHVTCLRYEQPCKIFSYIRSTKTCLIKQYVSHFKSNYKKGDCFELKNQSGQLKQ